MLLPVMAVLRFLPACHSPYSVSHQFQLISHPWRVYFWAQSQFQWDSVPRSLPVCMGLSQVLLQMLSHSSSPYPAGIFTWQYISTHPVSKVTKGRETFQRKIPPAKVWQNGDYHIPLLEAPHFMLSIFSTLKVSTWMWRAQGKKHLRL